MILNLSATSFRNNSETMEKKTKIELTMDEKKFIILKSADATIIQLNNKSGAGANETMTNGLLYELLFIC